jgi:hypothetical protein
VLYFSHAPSQVSTLDTGLDAGNDPPASAGGQNDANWTVNGIPAVVLSRNNQGSASFVADSATSGWIGVADSQSQPTGVTTFSTTFNLADQAHAQSEVLAGLWWFGSYGDGTATGTLDLNGHQIAANPGNPCNCNTNGALFAVNDSNGWFTAGTNTLSITLTDPNSEQDGVRLQLLNTVTIDQGVTINGTGTVTDNYNGEGQELIDNKGLIDANLNGQTLTVDPTAFINDGTAQSDGGGNLDIGNPNTGGVNTVWTNDGAISATGSGPVSQRPVVQHERRHHHRHQQHRRSRRQLRP